MNGADGERKNKRDVGEGAGEEAEEEVAPSQQRRQWGKSCKVAGAPFPEQSRLQQSEADFSLLPCLSFTSPLLRPGCCCCCCCCNVAFSAVKVLPGGFSLTEP